MAKKYAMKMWIAVVPIVYTTLSSRNITRNINYILVCHLWHHMTLSIDKKGNFFMYRDRIGGFN